MTYTQATSMARWATEKGFNASARRAKFSEGWVVEINGRAYGMIHSIKKACGE